MNDSELKCPWGDGDFVFSQGCQSPRMLAGLNLVREMQQELLTGTPWTVDWGQFLERVRQVLDVCQIYLGEQDFASFPLDTPRPWRLQSAPETSIAGDESPVKLPFPDHWLATLARGEAILTRVGNLPGEEAAI